MKSYLSLIPISAKLHKRQNRMTLFCIIIAVFLVTAVFSMADMGIRTERTLSINKHGNWHIMLSQVPERDAALIRERGDVAAASGYAVLNLDFSKDYGIGGKKAALCGVDETFITDIMNYYTEDARLRSDRDIILTANAKDILGVSTGDAVTLNTPSGSRDYTISGFTASTDVNEDSTAADDSALIVKHGTVGAFMNRAAFHELCGRNNEKDNPVYYVQFKNHANIKKAITNIKEQYGLTDENIEQNTALLGAMGLSDNSNVSLFYVSAAILFVLILAAGVLMITGSINSNIAERSQFFGMLRCIGADRKQIIRFVRLEALRWCKAAIPIGAMLGIVTTWGLCAVMRAFIGGEFTDMPVLGVSAVGIVCGIIVGILTVLLAAQSPAKRAARVSPVAAVSGCAQSARNVRHAADTRFVKIETALGIHHAVSAKKNFILMTGSFALSIIMFLSFSVVVEFTGRLVGQTRPSNPDLTIAGRDGSHAIDKGLADKIGTMPGVKRVFGRMYRNIPAAYRENTGSIDLLSYEKHQFHWAKKDILSGDLSKVNGDSNYVLTFYDENNLFEPGDKIRLDGCELEIAGILSNNPFSAHGDMGSIPTVICSEETFTRLTGEHNYALIDVQLTGKATDKEVSAIRGLADEEDIFSDRRASNREAIGTTWAFKLLVYGFLAIIAMITVLNIINSISMSVSARIKQYGAMRAVGMEGRQITKMIAAEAFTYALTGCMAGCALGLPLNYLLFDKLITPYFNNVWQLPFLPIAVIVLLVALSSVAAVYTPAKRLANMAVTDTINEQ